MEHHSPDREPSSKIRSAVAAGFREDVTEAAIRRDRRPLPRDGRRYVRAAVSVEPPAAKQRKVMSGRDRRGSRRRRASGSEDAIRAPARATCRSCCRGPRGPRRAAVDHDPRVVARDAWRRRSRSSPPGSRPSRFSPSASGTSRAPQTRRKTPSSSAAAERSVRERVAEAVHRAQEARLARVVADRRGGSRRRGPRDSPP